MSNDPPAPRGVVLVYDDPANFCCWARLDTGLEFLLERGELLRVPIASIEPGYYDGGRIMTVCERAGLLLGLPCAA